MCLCGARRNSRQDRYVCVCVCVKMLTVLFPVRMHLPQFSFSHTVFPYVEKEEGTVVEDKQTRVSCEVKPGDKEFSVKMLQQLCGYAPCYGKHMLLHFS